MDNLIRVKLTFGEQADNAYNNTINAESFIDHESDSKIRQETLLNKLNSLNESVTILSLERLFNRNINGFGEIKSIVSDLFFILNIDKLKYSPLCHLNAFTFAFLAAAKNYDLFIAIDNKQEVKEKVEQLVAEINSLTEFERIGKPLAEKYGSLKAPYLSLRQMIARPSARDEQRILALTLISGSMTFEKLEAALGCNTSLIQRILAMFVADKVILENRLNYSINENYLAIVLLCLRETHGMDPLNILQNILGDQ